MMPDLLVQSQTDPSTRDSLHKERIKDRDAHTVCLPDFNVETEYGCSITPLRSGIKQRASSKYDTGAGRTLSRMTMVSNMSVVDDQRKHKIF